MIRIPVSLLEEQHEYVRGQAFKEKCSMSDIIRKAVQEMISNNGHTEEVKRIKIEMDNDPLSVRDELQQKISGGNKNGLKRTLETSN